MLAAPLFSIHVCSVGPKPHQGSLDAVATSSDHKAFILFGNQYNNPAANVTFVQTNPQLCIKYPNLEISAQPPKQAADPCTRAQAD